MTDMNEIICALDKLKYGNHTYGDSVTAKNAIDFINSQKAEIERLEKELDTETNHDELIKALRYDREQYNKGYEDGVKELIECLREKGKVYSYDFTEYVLLEDIENFVNELTPEPTKIEHNSLCETETYESR